MTMINKLPYGYQFVYNVAGKGNLICTIKDYDDFQESYVVDLNDTSDNTIEYNVLVPVFKLLNVIKVYNNNGKLYD